MPFALEDAIAVAVAGHRGQVDKVGEPYILHPIRVMMRFPPYKRKQRIVAILHDVIEDTHYTAADLRGLGCDNEIIEAIQAMTHLGGETREEYMARVCANDLASEVKYEDIGDNTSMERLLRLDGPVQDRLINKYTKDLRMLDQRGL